MGISETNVEELESFLKAKKNQGQRVGLFLGHRTGILYKGNLYEALKSHTTTAEDLLNLFRYDTLVAQELSKWKHRIQLFASLPTPIKFKECYIFLGRHFSENGVHSTLFRALKPSHIREEDEIVAKLIKAEFFDTILTTNFDTLLEDACDILGMKKPEDYELFICGSDDSTAIGQSISRYGQIVKVFGDFDSLNYKTVGNEFDLEADQSFKKVLVSEMAKEVVVLGYDPTWDKPIERVFQERGGMLWYVNEEQPSPNTHIAHVLSQRYSKFIGGPEWSYSSFLQTLFNLIGEKVSSVPEIKSSLSLAPSHDSMRKKAFISYSHKDKEYLDRLRIHLKGFLHKKDEKDALKIICDDVWDDTKIAVGANWQKEIEEALTQTKVAVCLVSADFFSSDFIRENELPMLYEAARANQITIVSIIISASVFEDSELKSYQTINIPNEPLKKMAIHEQEVAWAKLAKSIFTILTS